MKLKNIFICLISVFIIISCNDANVSPDFAKGFIKYYGGSSEPNVASKVEVTDDGGYILIGTSSSFGNKSPQVYLVKTDQFGNTQWEKNYGGVGIDSGRAVKQTSDGGYILFGSYQTTVSGKGISSMYLVKTTNTGDTLWTKVYNESTPSNVFGLDLTLGIDGTSFLLAGLIVNNATGRNDAYIRKVASNGEVSLAIPATTSPNRYPNSILEINDNNIYWFGSGGLINGDVKVSTPILAGLNKDGNSFFAYDKTAPNIKEDDNLTDNMQNAAEAKSMANDSGYIVTGTSINNGIPNAYILKLNNTGSPKYVEKAFYKEFGNTNVTYGSSVIETKDGGFVMVGSTVDPDSKTAGGGFDIYVVKTDKNGNKLWEQTFGGPSNDFGSSVKQTPDGGYIIAGTISLVSSPVDNQVMCLIKIDDNGEIRNK